MIPTINQLLLDRIQKQGAITDEVPALLRDLSKILESNLRIDTRMVNSKLHLLGCNGVALDYQSLQLVLAWMEIEAGTVKESPPSPPNLHHIERSC